MAHTRALQAWNGDQRKTANQLDNTSQVVKTFAKELSALQELGVETADIKEAIKAFAVQQRQDTADLHAMDAVLKGTSAADLEGEDGGDGGDGAFLEKIQKDYEARRTVFFKAAAVKKKEEDILRALGEEVGGTNDDEDIVEEPQEQNLVCPLSRVLFVDPVRNASCGHVFSRAHVLQHLHSGAQRSRCPIAGCGHPISIASIEPDEETIYALDRAKRIRSAVEQTQAENDEQDAEEDEEDEDATMVIM